MNNLLVIGAGGHGRVVADAALAAGRYDTVGFLDDRFAEYKSALGKPVLGPISAALSFLHEYSDAVVAIGDNQLRLELINKLLLLGFYIPVIIHPKAAVGADIRLGPGTVILANAVVNTGSVLGIGVIVNTGATVDHDNVLGDGAHVSPGVHLAGEVSIGSFSWIGTGAVIIPQVQVGEHSIVGAGAVVIRNVPDGVTVVGVPAHILRKGSDNEDGDSK